MACPHVAGALAVLYSTNRAFYSNVVNGYALIQNRATKGRISDVVGSPNRLLYLNNEFFRTGDIGAVPVGLQGAETHSQASNIVPVVIGVGCLFVGLLVVGAVIYRKRNCKKTDEVILLADQVVNL